MSISLRDVSKKFGAFTALDKVSLDVPDGSLVALLGPSGSGKTTLLRIIAGLESGDSGSVLVRDEDVTRQSPRERNVGFVFQHYALFRHMTVFENVAFGLRIRRAAKAEIARRVGELLRLVRLDGLERRYPAQLSGGQRQRVALARALAIQPRVLLLDEPFGALDAKVRQELRQWLRRLHDEIRMTTVFVTHDQEEAFEVADEVVLMNEGRIEQQGPPRELFEKPRSAFVMDFLGRVNVFQGWAQRGQAVVSEGLVLNWPEATGDPRRALAYVRPHELTLDRTPNGRPHFSATIERIVVGGSVIRVYLSASSGQPIQVDVPPERFAQLALEVGDRVHVSPHQWRVFSPEPLRLTDLPA